MNSQSRIDQLLRKRGLKKISTVQYTANGTHHSFDNEFIEALDNYLSGNPKSLTKSHWNNITLFIKYADGEINSSHSEYERLVECDKYLATIGVK